VTAADYTTYSITAPSDARLPGGGGNTVSGMVDLNPNRVGQVDNYVTFAENFGKQTEHWNGVDITLNARPGQGILLQGGVSTGRTSFNNCEVRAKLPELAIGAPFTVNTGSPYCDITEKMRTQMKLLGTYTVPKIDVLFPSTIQSLPGPLVPGNFVALNGLIQPSLGRPLSGGAQNATVNLVEPGTMYGERLNQLDLRFAKVLRFGRTKSAINFDLYNSLNANAITSQNNTFGSSWQTPLSILDARLFKISAQFDF
jgi:hypothetical protein